MIDLHMHSNCSDGTDSLEELYEKVKAAGITVFTLTDHDTVAGISSAILETRSYPVTVIPGVEISSALGGRIIHILGYNVEYNNPGFIGALRVIVHYRDERNIKICAQLRSYGIIKATNKRSIHYG